MIRKEKKLTYKIKNASFAGNGQLLDEDGEIINLVHDLEKVFGAELFDITVNSASKEDLEIEDFNKNKEEE